VLGGHRLPLSEEQRSQIGGRRTVVVGLRPADFGLRAVDVQAHDDSMAHRVARLPVTADVVEHLGSEQLLVFPIDAPRYAATHHAAGPDDEDSLLVEPARSRFTARLDMRREVAHGEQLDVYVDLDRLYLFDAETGEALRGPIALPGDSGAGAPAAGARPAASVGAGAGVAAPAG
jgi:hypothetical protein